MTEGSLSVFVNCPFDEDYRDFFQAIVFTVIRSGFIARCALEVDNGADNRLEKICKIIKECRYGVHDISRTEVDGHPPLPRFNMPLELGLFLGARKFGGRPHQSKMCIILDRERFRYQRFISDIAGQDIHSHGGNRQTLITELAGWLRHLRRRDGVPGGHVIAAEYEEFSLLLPAFLQALQIGPAEMTFNDFSQIVIGHLAPRA